MMVAVASEYRLQPEVNKGLQAREALFSLEKRGHGNGAEAPEPLPPEGGTLARWNPYVWTGEIGLSTHATLHRWSRRPSTCAGALLR